MSEQFIPRNNSITIAATGDCMISRPVSVYKDILPIVELLKKTDVRFTNCETLFHRGESYAMARERDSTRMCTPPSVAKEMSWIGFNIVSLCNNHVMDYGPPGLFSTMNSLEESGIVHAGAGRDLDEAREPRYVETEKGRTALIACCWAGGQQPWERASNMNAGIPARPGLNQLRVKTTYTVTNSQFVSMKEIASAIGLNPPNGMVSRLRDNELNFIGHSFKVGRKASTTRRINQYDVDDLIKAIADARKTADWALVSFHVHDYDRKGAQYPAGWVREFSRTCIDAGADAFLGTGAHLIQGIEVYKRKPIFYSLGNFIVQDLVVNKVTFDQYEFVGLGRNAKPSDFFDSRKGSLPPPNPPYAQMWFESIIPVFQLDDGGLKWMKIYPITMNFEEKSPVRRGRPILDLSEKGKAVLKRLQELSNLLGTKIDLTDSYAEVKL